MSIQTNESHSQIINPNLLINPDFKINQRGQTTYTPAWNQYTVDRWSVEADSDLTVTVNGDTITLVNNSTDPRQIKQIIEDKDIFISNKAYTMSIEVISVGGNGYKYCSLEMNESPYTHPGNLVISLYGAGVYSKTGKYDLDPTYEGRLKFVVALDGGCSITFRHPKLEIGSTATTFIPPEHSLELLKCKRYYQRIGPGLTVFTRYPNGGILYYGEFPVEMRDVPTISLLTTSINIYACDNTFSDDGFNGHGYHTDSGYISNYIATTKDIKFIIVDGFDGMIPGLICHSNNEEDIFAFDAEIY